MALRKVKIINCKEASIRRTPWNPLHDKDISGIRKGVSNNSNKVSIGSTIEIDTNEVSYNWQGRKFYKVKNPRGWIYEGCIDYREEVPNE